MKKFVLILGLLILFSPAAIVIADDHTEGEVPTPAIVVEEPPEQIEDVAWTYRFFNSNNCCYSNISNSWKRYSIFQTGNSKKI